MSYAVLGLLGWAAIIWFIWYAHTEKEREQRRSDEALGKETRLKEQRLKDSASPSHGPSPADKPPTAP